MTAAGTIRRWSTKTVPPTMRFDYWMSVMKTALWPVTDYQVSSSNFVIELEEASLGCLSSMIETSSPHEARRTRIDVQRTEEHCYHLFISLGSSWGLSHHGRSEHLRRGDVVLVGEEEHETIIPSGFHGVILKCPGHWLASWVPDPDLLVGRRIAVESRWGQILSPTVSQLTPAFAADSPLPHNVITDQLGTLLALTAGETEQAIHADLARAIRSAIREHCTAPLLDAAQVAAILNIPTTLLHHALAEDHCTFAILLLEARAAVAAQLLAAPASANSSDADIARCAGFPSLQHCARVLRQRTGRTMQELRRPTA